MNFDTVVKLKEATLTVGQLVHTKGYTTAGDGGGATYLIKAPQSVDELKDHTLVNNNVAERLEVSPTAQLGVVAENSPFGKTGLRLAVGEKRDAHYAWGSIVEIPDSNKWVMIYRKGTEHGIEDGAETRATDSYDYGVSWVNDRLVHTDPATDSRADRIALMANGRIGFFCNRGADVGPNKYPLFISSDDDGVTWNTLEVPTSSLTYTFAAVGGIVDFPASQGGSDTTGFVSFGYIDATGIDAFTTVDNGDSWQTVSNVNGSAVVSENVIIRLGDTDRWLIFVRANPDLLVYATTNLLSWGTSQVANLESLSSPPGGYYDPLTDKVYYFGTARSGKELDGYTNNILQVGEDADTLWAAGGVFTESYKSLVTLPNWTTGYISPFSSRIGACATVTAGENVANGLPPSSVWLIGNFDTNGADIGMFVDKFTRNMKNINAMEITAVDNTITTYPVVIENRAGTATYSIGGYGEERELGGANFLGTYNAIGGTFTHNYTCDEFSTVCSADYRFSANGLILWDSDNHLFGGLTAKINNDSAAMFSGVQGSTSPALRTQAFGTGSSRKHIVFHHSLALPAAEVGSISTTTTTTAFNVTSDETLKDFIGEYAGDDAVEVIKADPVREFTWKSTGEAAIGWGAQTSHSIREDLATKGGWFIDDEEVEEGTEGAEYVQWGVDHSKRTPYLWAAVTQLLARVEELEKQLNDKG